MDNKFIENIFLVSSDYTGDDCGITVSLRGLESDINYEKILISTNGVSKEVNADSEDNFKSTDATFTDLEEDKFYKVNVFIYVNNELFKRDFDIPAQRKNREIITQDNTSIRHKGGMSGSMGISIKVHGGSDG